MSLSSRIRMFSDSSLHAKPMFTAVSANPARLQLSASSRSLAPAPRGPAHHRTLVSPLQPSPPPPPHRLLASCSDWSRLAVCHYRAGQPEVALGLRLLGLESLKGLGTAQRYPGRWDEGRDPEAHHTLSKHENVKFI